MGPHPGRLERTPMKTHAGISLVEVLVPDLGDVKDVPIIEVLARVGEQVAVDQTIAVLERRRQRWTCLRPRRVSFAR